MSERPNRSDSYQYRICEVNCSDAMMNAFTNDQGIYAHLNPYHYNEEYLILKDELKKEFWKLAEEVCTERQFEIMKMLCGGMTQMEIADKLGVNQSSITKSLNGNIDYARSTTRVYGGLIKKLKKHIENHKRIQEILEKMCDLQEEY